MRTHLYVVLAFAVIALLGCPAGDDGGSADDGQAGSQAGSGGKQAASGGAGGSSAATGGAGTSASDMDASASSSDKDAAVELDAATPSPDKDASTGSGEGVSEQCKTCLRANQQGCAGVLLGCERPSPCAMCLEDAYGPGITGTPGSCKDTPVFTMLGGCACMYCADDCNTECTTFWKQPS